MKPLEKDELYENISSFLKGRGIELKDGSYAQGIQKSCGFLADAINLGQEGFEKAKEQIDKNLEHMRQVIHEKTAPKTSTGSTRASSTPPPPPNAAQRRIRRRPVAKAASSANRGKGKVGKRR
jgi:hypothetical protein